MRSVTEIVVPFVLIVWCSAFVVMTMFGLMDRIITTNNDCDTPARRISVVLPGYMFGCWLGEPIK